MLRVYTPDSGGIKIHGQESLIDSPAASQQAGVGIIFQEFNLIPSLTARENIFLGQEDSPFSWIARGQEDEQASSRRLRRTTTPPWKLSSMR